MKNLTVEYLGLKLKSPIIVSSSPFTSSVERIVELERHGAGAVVLKSIFEEQIIGESAVLESYNDYPEAADYLRSYIEDDYLNGFLKMIEQAKAKVTIPIIASINCTTNGDWVDYAKKIESAGADALELNIFMLPTDINASSEQIENQYMKVIERVTAAISIPVAVKLSIRFTNILSIASRIYNRKAKGIVLYNRLFEPDVDIENMKLVGSDSMSTASELRNSLRTIAMSTAQLPLLDVSVSSGVHSGEDVVKSLLIGAKSVQVCSALYIHGLGAIEQMNNFVSEWMTRHNYQSIAEFCGKMNYKGVKDSDYYQRVQYMKYFPKNQK